MSDSEYSEIDSDDDFIKCSDCEIEVDIAEVCFYKKCKFCKSCFEDCIQLEIAQPVRMIVKVCEDMSYSCCSRKNCIRIKCCGTVKGHVDLYSCDPEIINYPLGLAGIFNKENMHCVRKQYLNGRSVSTFSSSPFEETNLLRRLRLQKTERLEKENERSNLIKEQFKIKKQKENAKKLETEKLAVCLQQKERWDNLTIGTKIVELEAQLCYKLHNCFNPYDYNVGARLSLYENNRFKTLDSVILHSVIEQAHQAYRTKQFEEKDHMEDILSILEKWLEDVYPEKYREIKGLPIMPPPTSI